MRSSHRSRRRPVFRSDGIFRNARIETIARSRDNDNSNFQSARAPASCIPAILNYLSGAATFLSGAFANSGEDELSRSSMLHPLAVPRSPSGMERGRSERSRSRAFTDAWNFPRPRARARAALGAERKGSRFDRCSPPPIEEVKYIFQVRARARYPRNRRENEIRRNAKPRHRVVVVVVARERGESHFRSRARARY